MRNKPTLVIMLKEPRAGRVKTRLGRDIGMTAAAWWFRHQSARLIRRVQSPKWETVLAIAPDTALSSPIWPAHLPRMSQGRGDLGARMARVFRTLCGPVCIIGADIPGVTPALIAQAFAALGRSDACFGPAPDGGYWLIGLNRAPRGLFQNVRWSSEHALNDTLASIPNLRAEMIATLNDVDTVQDLKR